MNQAVLPVAIQVPEVRSGETEGGSSSREAMRSESGPAHLLNRHMERSEAGVECVGQVGQTMTTSPPAVCRSGHP